MRLSLSVPPRRLRAAAVAALVMIGTLGLPAAKSFASDAVLRGIVKLPDGSPARRADVYVYLLETEPGDGYQEELAHTVAEEDGTFSIPLSVTSSVATLAATNGGIVNFEIHGVASSTGQTLSNLGPYVQGQAGNAEVTIYDGALALGASVVGAVEGVTGGTLEFLNVVNLLLDDAVNGRIGPEDDNLAQTDPGTDAPPVVRAQHDSSCRFTGWRKVSGPNGAPTVIGELHTYQDMTGKFEYTRSANTDIGVGYSRDGSQYKVSGEVKIRNGVEAGNSGVSVGSHWGHQILGRFNHVKERNDFYCYWRREFTDYRVRATVWNGDVYPGVDTSDNDGYYQYKDAVAGGSSRILSLTPGQRFWRIDKKGHDYKAGVTVFGATLNSQTSFNSTHKLEWKAGSKNYWHYLIGNNGPPTTAGIIYAY